jgi:lipopolysaccharide export system permease protein
MIPILWRYTAFSYLKTFFLTLGTFVVVLLISRFKEIARFTTLSADPVNLSLFAVYQIPFILPMAIPLSALIASFLFFQKISRSQELTALRACGLGLKKILAPICIACLLLSMLNFSICATLAPFCQRQAGKLLVAEIAATPLLLLKKQDALENKDAFIKMDVSADGKKASSAILVTYNEGNKRLNLLSAQDLSIEKDQLNCHSVSIISHLDGKETEFDPLIVETQDSMLMGMNLLDPHMKKKPKNNSVSSLSFRLLQESIASPNQAIEESLSEIFRRISFSLAVFSLTLLGAIFGIDQGRTPSKKNLVFLLALTLTALASYLLGKSFRHAPLLSACVYCFPHLLIWISCYFQARRITKGLA